MSDVLTALLVVVGGILIAATVVLFQDRKDGR